MTERIRKDGVYDDARSASDFHNLAGMKMCQRNVINRGWVVTYVAKAQGIDVGRDKYVTVCETHGTMCGTRTLAAADAFLSFPEFCELCMADAKARGMI